MMDYCPQCGSAFKNIRAWMTDGKGHLTFCSHNWHWTSTLPNAPQDSGQWTAADYEWLAAMDRAFATPLQEIYEKFGDRTQEEILENRPKFWRRLFGASR